MTLDPPLLDTSSGLAVGTNKPLTPPQPMRTWRSTGWGSLSCGGFSLLLLYFLCQIAYAFPTALLSPCLDEFASSLHKSKGSLAASPTLSAAVTMCGSFLSGWCLDLMEGRIRKSTRCRPCQRRLGHIMLSLSMIFLGVTYFFIPFTPPRFEQFLLVQMVGGLFVSFVNVISTTLAIRLGVHAENDMIGGEVVDSSRRIGAFSGACVSIVHVGVGAGGVLAPLAANLSYALTKKRMLAYMWLAPFTLVIVTCINLLIPPPPIHIDDADAEAPLSNSVVGSINEGRVIAKSLRSERVGDRIRRFSSGLVGGTSDKPFDWSFLAMLLVCMMFAEGAIYGPIVYIVSVLHSLGFTENDASLVFSVGSFGLAGGRLVLSFVGTRFTPSQILLTMLPAALIFNVGQCFLVSTSLITQPGWPKVLFVICYVGNSLGVSCAYAWLLALYSSRQTVNGTVNGMALVAVSVGMVLCVNLGGYLYQNVGAISFFIANACIAFVGVLSVVFFVFACKRSSQRNLGMPVC